MTERSLSKGNAIELPVDFSSALEVVERSGTVARREWLLRDPKSNQLYRVTPDLIKDRVVQVLQANVGPSIIIAAQGDFVVALHLPTAQIYKTGAPPARLA